MEGQLPVRGVFKRIVHAAQVEHHRAIILLEPTAIARNPCGIVTVTQKP
jgi:hypothetical protein